MSVFQYDANIIGVANAEAGTNRCSQWHNGGASDIFEALGRDGVVVDVRQHNKSLLDENLCRLKSCRYIRKECLIVTDDCKLDHFANPRLARKPTSANRIVCGV